jgi:EAL domain-containing protein (putative c-di-GMP-specific phosphodiesterase class I)
MVLTAGEVRATLEALRGLGVRLGVDDFGTGYSSLTTLRTLPLDIVKIDRSFVAGGPANPADHAVVSGITQMARRLGLETIGEGVERLDQQRLLHDVGVNGVQGYLHLRPVPAADLQIWLAGRAGPDGQPLPARADASLPAG